MFALFSQSVPTRKPGAITVNGNTIVRAEGKAAPTGPCQKHECGARYQIVTVIKLLCF